VAGLGAYLVPGGGGAATSALGRVGTAAARGAGAGALSGFGLSDEGQELSSTLRGGALGGVIGGAFQGVSEGAQALAQRKAQAGGEVINTMNVDEIAKLPDRTRKGLAKQAKSAGFWDSKVSESKNIQNYLQNRGLAGNTPAETLENLTQEFNRAQALKQEGLDEVGGLSRSYLRQVKDNIDEAIAYKGIGLDPESTRVYNDIVKTLEKGPTGAKELDNIIMKWNEAGRLARGAQKTSTAGLYADAARELRNVMRSTSPTYDSALQALNQILGIEDVGQVAKTAGEAARAGFDMPLFAGAGFHGADIKTPMLSDIVNKTRAAQGRALEQGAGALGGLGQGIGQAAPAISQAAQIGQQAIPALPALFGQGQEVEQGMGPEMGMGQPGMSGMGMPGMEPDMYGQMGQAQGPQINQMALIEAVMSGQMSISEANWLMEMLGGQQGGVDTSKLNEHALTAIDALDQIERLIEDVPLAESGIGGFFKGPLLSAAGKTGVDENVRLYEAIREAFGATLARASGETGNLTDEDVKRALGKLPQLGDSREMARRKMKEARNFLYTRLGVTPQELGRDDGSALYDMLGL